MNLIDKTYEPQSIEQHWYQTWETNGYFEPKGNGKPYCIVLPPPNVTGSLHMGHGFGFTLIDILIRYQRMCGKKTLWQGGTDHAGIATQMVVERQLNQNQQTRHDLGRETFVEKIWQWKEESGGNISRQLRRLGASIDWDRERFTMDEELSHAVREVFIQLYEEGLIYRGKRLVNWDPILLTAISDLEVINQEEEGKLWSIRYPIKASESKTNIEYVTVATTRPETLLGDVAIAVNPEDERFKDLIGQEIRVPLTERFIPVIADSYVDPNFGTGCVKITPAHDFNDYAIGVRHHLSSINIFTPTAHLNENVPAKYQGLDRFAARKVVLKDLEAAGLLAKEEKHVLKVPRGDRSNAVIEPYLTYQWYVKSKPLAEPAIQAVEKGDVTFIPANWDKTYFQWMRNIEDWCISRQLWWGHRIPIWYDNTGKTYAGHNEADVRKRHQLSAEVPLTQDEDVLDTWFSAGLWPFSSLGWPQTTDAYQTFFPTNTLITGFDIIFFWVARMIMMSLKFTGKVPFNEVYITGLIRDAEGHKMSKSKGNVLDPIDLIDGIDLETLVAKRISGLMQPKMAEKIEKATRKEYPEGIFSYGTDALRFTFASVASYTREIRFDINRLTGYRNFCNKLWNAARFVFMNTSEQTELKKPEQFGPNEQWIWSELQRTIAQAHQALGQYRFDLYAQAVYEFTWNQFCDWYVELSKPALMGENHSEQNNVRYTLVHVLETLMRLLHPIMPFITEEIWQKLKPLTQRNEQSIMLADFPQMDNSLINEAIEQEINWLKAVVIAIRTVRSEMNIAPNKRLTLLCRKGNNVDKENIARYQSLLLSLAKCEAIQWLDDQIQPPESASAFVGDLEMFIPLAGLIDTKEEQTRLQRELEKIEKELTQVENKLKNPQFIARAPEAVVSKEQQKQNELKLSLNKVSEQLKRLGG